MLLDGGRGRPLPGDGQGGRRGPPRQIRPPRYYPLFHTAITTGLRHGELLGLKWSDVDFDAASLAVRRTIYWNPPDGPQLQEPKTPGSRRKVLLGGDTLAVLSAHRRQQLKERLAAGPAWIDGDLVFRTLEGKPPYGPNITSYYKRLAARAEVPVIRFHDARHTCATLLLAQPGVNVKAMAERLGHANVSITLNTYAHVLPDMQRAAAKALEGLFRREE